MLETLLLKNRREVDFEIGINSKSPAIWLLVCDFDDSE